MILTLKRCSLSLLLCVGLHAPSCSAEEAEPMNHWHLQLSGALTNSDTLEVDPSITYIPLQYVGIGLGFLFTNTIHGNGYVYQTANSNLSFTLSERDYNYELALRPQLTFVTPAWYVNADKDVALKLHLSPGLTLPIPTNGKYTFDFYYNEPGIQESLRREIVKNTGAKACYFHLRTAVSLELEKLTFSLGYQFSNFDIYGGARNLVVDGKTLSVPHSKDMHAAFAAIGVLF